MGGEELTLFWRLPLTLRTYRLATHLLTEHRGILVTVFVLPISLTYDVFFQVRSTIVQAWFSAPKLHEKRVRFITQQILDWRKDASLPRKLTTARGGWLSISPGYRTYKSRSTQIKVDLYDVLELNVQEMYVKVEPQVSMGQLSHFLIPKGYTIPVLPELDDLTVGGLYMGVGIETSSHKYGLFNDTVIEAEIVTADGTVLVCSETQNKELFDALPWSYGTLGFLASCKIKVIPCKPYLRIEYIPCKNREEGVALLTKYAEAENPVDFVEALAYSKDTMVVMPANFVDEKEVISAQKNSIGLWYKPWFYKHVEEFLHKPEKNRVEYIPLRDYFHRHTKSIFWEMEDIIPWGNNVIFRWLLGWAIPPKVSFLKLTQTKALQKLYEESHVLQDMLVPLSKASEILEVFHENYQIYPLWICPYRAYDYSFGRKDGAPHRCFLRRPKIVNSRGFEMYVDIGAYGTPQMVKDNKPFDAVGTGNRVESYVASVHGFQMLYADSYLDKVDFVRMFDHSHYYAMKAKYDPENAFPEVFDKTCKKAPLNQSQPTKSSN